MLCNNTGVGIVVRLTAAGLMLAAGSTLAHAQCSGYTISSSTGATITPGITDVGNHGDDVTTNITLPFPVSLYGTSYNSARVSSNGTMQFTTSSTAYSNICLPDAALGVSLLPHWDDLRTDGVLGGIDNGIYTSISGVAPNRVYNIEWRAVYYNNTATRAAFQIRLYEDNSRIEYVYGTVAAGGTGATVGLQNASVANTQFSCNTGGLVSGRMLTITPNSNSTSLCPTSGASPAGVTNCNGATTLFTVNVPPASDPASTGIVVVGNLTSVGGASSVQFFNDGTNGDVTAGDNVHSYRATIPSSVTVGTKIVPFTVSDEQGRTGAGSISLVVNCVAAPNPTLGPDVYTIAITDIPRWGTDVSGTITAYSVGTTSSNEGDFPVLWIDSDNHAPNYDNTQHPVISQNMYRLKEYPGGYKRFEQLGQSWLKHGFVSTNSGPNCQPSNVWRYDTQAYQNIGGDALGVNCTDTYGGGLNGSQGLLGPKFLVNATYGSSPFVRGTGTGDATTRARLQVPTVDVTNQPAGTRFFFDAFYVTADDAQFVRPGQTVAVNAMNNASWTEITAATVNTSPFITGGTRLRNPGIFAWKAADPSVALVAADHDDTPNPGTGYRNNDGSPAFAGTFIKSRYWVAAKATPLAGGLYRYEYAVYNHNSDRSADRFTLPMPVNASVSDIYFRAPSWHSGEPYSNAAWTTSRNSTGLTFKTQSFAVNPNANALRWACLFNFGFTSNIAPVDGAATIGLFKPGFGPTPITAINASAVPVPTMPDFCGPADIGSQGGVVGHDNTLDNNDFVVFIDLFFNSDVRADFGGQGGEPGADGQFNNNDFIVFIDQFFAGC